MHIMVTQLKSFFIKILMFYIYQRIIFKMERSILFQIEEIFNTVEKKKDWVTILIFRLIMICQILRKLVTRSLLIYLIGLFSQF